jgi:hypothetical protein
MLAAGRCRSIIIYHVVPALAVLLPLGPPARNGRATSAGKLRSEI